MPSRPGKLSFELEPLEARVLLSADPAVVVVDGGAADGLQAGASETHQVAYPTAFQSAVADASAPLAAADVDVNVLSGDDVCLSAHFDLAGGRSRSVRQRIADALDISIALTNSHGSNLECC